MSKRNSSDMLHVRFVEKLQKLPGGCLLHGRARALEAVSELLGLALLCLAHKATENGTSLSGLPKPSKSPLAGVHHPDNIPSPDDL